MFEYLLNLHRKSIPNIAIKRITHELGFSILLSTHFFLVSKENVFICEKRVCRVDKRMINAEFLLTILNYNHPLLIKRSFTTKCNN